MTGPDRTRLLVALAALLLAAPGAQAAETLALRVGSHPGFSRLVFDWTTPVETRLEQAPGRAKLRFDRAATLDTGRFRPGTLPEVTGIASESGPDGLTVVVQTLLDTRLRLFENGPSVVLDVLRAATALNAAPHGAGPVPVSTVRPLPEEHREEARDNPVTIAAGTEPSVSGDAPRLIVPEPPPAPRADAETAQTEPFVPLQGLQPAARPEPMSVLPRSLTDDPPPHDRTLPQAGPDQPKAGSAASNTEEAKSTEREVPAAAKTGRTHTAQSAADQTAAAKPAEKPEQLAALPKRSEAVSQSDPSPEAKVSTNAEAQTPPDSEPVAEPTTREVSELDPTALPTHVMLPEAPIELDFAFAQPTPAALFRRGGRLWLLFDGETEPGLSERLAREAPDLAPSVRALPSGATLVGFTLSTLEAPTLARDGTAWRLRLGSGLPDPRRELALERDDGAGPLRIRIPLEEPGRRIALEDPALGGSLIVVPVMAEGLGLPEPRSYPEFRVLASHQGVVLQPHADALTATLADDALELGSDDGVIASHGGSLALGPDHEFMPRIGARLFDLPAWRRGGAERFYAERQALQERIVEAGLEDRGPARLDLARFYFAHGLAPEARGLLALRDDEAEETLAPDPELRLLEGAIAFLMDDFETAARLVFGPALSGESEAELWRAALLAVRLDWKRAADSFRRVHSLISAYPKPVRMRLRLLGAEALLAQENTETAQILLGAILEDDPSHVEEVQAAYLIGRRLQLEGETNAADRLWERVADGDHAPSRARARLALLDQGLDLGTLPTEVAIEELERLRFAWRGDQFELALLQRLGELYVKEGDYAHGLELLRRAASYFPGSEQAQAIAERMRALFVGVFLGEEGQDMPALSALAFYESFRELTPSGELGDRLLIGLADRLIEVDLLDRADALLDDQMRHRQTGQARAEVGTRLAEIRLLDRRPEAALDALAGSVEPELPPALVERRTLARARALIALDRDADALALLEGDESPAAVRLRVEIRRERGEWRRTAELLRELAPPPPAPGEALSDAERGIVLELAVALTLADDRAALRDLAADYGAAMAQGPEAGAFGLLAGGPDVSAPERAEALSIAQELAEVGRVEAFLKSYRERIQQAEAK